MSDVLLTPHYAIQHFHTLDATVGWGDGHHHHTTPSAAHHLPIAGCYLLSCSARCNAERGLWATHAMQPRALKNPKSRSLPTQITWLKLLGMRYYESLSWKAEERNAEDCYGASSLQLKPLVPACIISDMKEDLSLCLLNVLICSLWSHWWAICHVSLFTCCLSFVPVTIYFRTILNSRKQGGSGKSNECF